MRKPIVQVDTLLKADKGRAAGQFAVPPIQYDGAGYPFAVDSSGDRIAICNDANLLLLDLKRRSKRLLRAPLGDQTEFWGVAFAPQNRLYVFLSDYTVALLNLQGSLLKRFGGGFGERADQFAGATALSVGSASRRFATHSRRRATVSLLSCRRAFEPTGRNSRLCGR